MGKIKGFVTKPRNCDAFATIPLCRCADASPMRSVKGVSRMKKIANRAICAAFLAAMLTVSAEAAAPGPSARFDWFEYRGSNPVDSTLHPGPNDYRNPVLR